MKNTFMHIRLKHHSESFGSDCLHNSMKHWKNRNDNPFIFSIIRLCLLGLHMENRSQIQISLILSLFHFEPDDFSHLRCEKKKRNLLTGIKVPQRNLCQWFCPNKLPIDDVICQGHKGGFIPACSYMSNSLFHGIDLCIQHLTCWVPLYMCTHLLYLYYCLKNCWFSKAQDAPTKTNTGFTLQ